MFISWPFRLTLGLCIGACSLARDPQAFSDDDGDDYQAGAAASGGVEGAMGDFSGGACSDGDPATACASGAGALQDDPACSDSDTTTACPDALQDGPPGGDGDSVSIGDGDGVASNGDGDGDTGDGDGDTGDGDGDTGDGDGDTGNGDGQGARLWGNCSSTSDCVDGDICNDIEQPASPSALTGGPTRHHCAAGCGSASDCTPPTSGNAVVVCTSQLCELECGGTTCPDGMECVLVFLGTGGGDRCGWK